MEMTRQNLNKKLGNRSRQGFTLVELMIVVSVIGLLATISIPNFIKARGTSQKNVCINNLRQVSSAIHQWALESKKEPSSPVTADDILPYLKSSVVCPAGGTSFSDSYSLSTVGNEPTCLKVSSLHTL